MQSREVHAQLIRASCCLHVWAPREYMLPVPTGAAGAPNCTQQAERAHTGCVAVSTAAPGRRTRCAVHSGPRRALPLRWVRLPRHPPPGRGNLAAPPRASAPRHRKSRRPGAPWHTCGWQHVACCSTAGERKAALRPARATVACQVSDAWCIGRRLQLGIASDCSSAARVDTDVWFNVAGQALTQVNHAALVGINKELRRCPGA